MRKVELCPPGTVRLATALDVQHRSKHHRCFCAGCLMEDVSVNVSTIYVLGKGGRRTGEGVFVESSSSGGGVVAKILGRYVPPELSKKGLRN